MSRAARGRKKDADDDDAGSEEAKPRRSAAAASSRRKGGGGGDKDGGDFPELAFDMGDLEAEMKTLDKKGGGGEDDDGEKTPPRKSRFPKRPDITDSAASSRAGSRAGSRKSSAERSHYTRMEDIDRWKWATKYSSEGDQSELRLAENMAAWEKALSSAEVQLPDSEQVDVAGTMQFRKFLWKNKKLCRNGVPPKYRLLVWSVVSGARTMPDRLEHLNRYTHYLEQSAHTLTSKAHKEIAADVSRALNAHPKFSSKTTKDGREELTKVLSAFAARSPAIGYVNSLSHIAAYFLLFYDAENAFWILCAIVDIVLPPDYFTQSLLGARADCMLMKTLVFQRLPKLHAHFAHMGLDVYSVALKWLMTLYFLCLSKECIARVLDVLFVEGSNILVSVGMAFFVTHEKDLLKIDDLMDMLQYINTLGSGFTNNDDLMRVILKEGKCKIGEEEERRRHTERAVMEDAYMRDLQKTQLHRRVEEEKRRADLEAKERREKEEEESLAMGIEMYKIGAYGEAKLTKVTMERMGKDDWIISWQSKRKKAAEAQMKISECTLHFGLRHGQFAARPEFQKRFQTAKKMAFTLQSPQRTLDVVCQTSHDMAEWKALFYRPGFPLKNSAAVLRHRRRIEKKKTLKRTKAAAQGKTNVRIESSDEDYDISDDESETPEEGAAPSASAAASSSSAARHAEDHAASAASASAKPARNGRSKAHEEDEEEEKPKKAGRRRFDDD